MPSSGAGAIRKVPVIPEAREAQMSFPTPPARGAAALSQRRQPLAPGFGTDIIRITPARIVAWNLDRPGYNSCFVP
jgi:hypothetical protein